MKKPTAKAKSLATRAQINAAKAKLRRKAAKQNAMKIAKAELHQEKKDIRKANEMKLQERLFKKSRGKSK